jgi:peptide/nickel transport system ATP-binding protein
MGSFGLHAAWSWDGADPQPATRHTPPRSRKRDGSPAEGIDIVTSLTNPQKGWEPVEKLALTNKTRNLNLAPVLIDAHNVSVEFHGQGHLPARAVDKVSFILREGEMLGLVGESGCGKTTLMLSLMRLLPSAGRIVGGQILFRGKDLLDLSESEIEDVRWRDISMIFQGAMNALNPVRTIGDQIEEAIVRHNSLLVKNQLVDRTKTLLDMVGISPDRKDQYPHQYSGGMRQRAMIAMALACSPQVVIADEPTTALDVMVQAQILELLDNLRHNLGLSVILVTHDLGVVAEICDSVLVMYGGVTAEYANVDTIFNNPQHPYTRQLLAAFPDLSKPKEKLRSISGYPPRLDDLPPGCRFAPRCESAYERCHVDKPALHRLGEFHQASCHLVER